MQIFNLIIIFIIFIATSIIYNKIKINESNQTNAYYHNMIEKYLLNQNNLGSVNKPILWVYMQNESTIIPEVNSRFWINFGSRNTTNFNQPYQKLTIQSIINKCENDFNICLIDNNSFKVLLPNWNIDLYKIAQPIRNHIQLIAITSLLNAYGGMMIPSSFICFKSLKPLYDAACDSNKIIVGKSRNLVSNNKLHMNTIAYPYIMGCKAGNIIMQEFSNYLSILNSNDFTSEQDFVGNVNIWLEENISYNSVIPICGKLLGIEKKDDSLIYPEELLESGFLELDNNSYGLYIPWDHLIHRINLEWFVRLSPEEVLNSNTIIGKYILINIK